MIATFNGVWERWPAPVYEDLPEHRPPGPEEVCMHCEEGFELDDPGVWMPYVGADLSADKRAIHLECHIRMGLGGLNHILGRCSCRGGSEEPDPPEMTRREAAKAAVEEWERIYGNPRRYLAAS